MLFVTSTVCAYAGAATTVKAATKDIPNNSFLMYIYIFINKTIFWEYQANTAIFFLMVDVYIHPAFANNLHILLVNLII